MINLIPRAWQKSPTQSCSSKVDCVSTTTYRYKLGNERLLLHCFCCQLRRIERRYCIFTLCTSRFFLQHMYICTYMYGGGGGKTKTNQKNWSQKINTIWYWSSKKCKSLFHIIVGLRRQPTLCKTIAAFPAIWCRKNKHQNSILISCVSITRLG